jgi:hypothetical protein
LRTFIKKSNSGSISIPISFSLLWISESIYVESTNVPITQIAISFEIRWQRILSCYVLGFLVAWLFGKMSKYIDEILKRNLLKVCW